jgi:hypothetical protein
MKMNLKYHFRIWEIEHNHQMLFKKKKIIFKSLKIIALNNLISLVKIHKKEEFSLLIEKSPVIANQATDKWVDHLCLKKTEETKF